MERLMSPPESRCGIGSLRTGGPIGHWPSVERSAEGRSPAGRGVPIRTGEPRLRDVGQRDKVPCRARDLVLWRSTGALRARVCCARRRTPLPATQEDPDTRWPARPVSTTSRAAQWAANGDALGPTDLTEPGAARLRRERLQPGGPEGAPAQGRLQEAPGDARQGRSRSTRRSPTRSRRRCASGRWRRARRTTRTGSSR